MKMGKPDRKEAKRQEENKSKKDSLENYYEAEKQELNNNRSRKRNVPADDDQGEGPGDHGGGHDGGGGQDIQDEDDAADGDYLNLGKLAGRDHNQNRVNIMPYIAEVERYFISDRAASALYNAALKTVGLITAEDTQKVVDKSKIVRGKASYRAAEKSKKMEKFQDLGGLGCVGVDGKRDRKSKKIVVEVINVMRLKRRRLVLKNT